MQVYVGVYASERNSTWECLDVLSKAIISYVENCSNKKKVNDHIDVERDKFLIKLY